MSTIFGGTGRQHEPEPEPLSEIIRRLNERFGTDFDPGNRILDAVAEKLIRRDDIQQAAAVNTPENFGLVLAKEFQSGMLDQLSDAEDMVLAYIDNHEMQAEVLKAYLPFIQGRARVVYI